MGYVQNSLVNESRDKEHLNKESRKILHVKIVVKRCDRYQSIIVSPS